MTEMSVTDEVIEVLGECLGLGNRVSTLSAGTQLLGNIPEFDSMAVVSVITALEERFGFTVDDDEVSAETFESVGSLAVFVDEKLAA